MLFSSNNYDTPDNIIIIALYVVSISAASGSIDINIGSIVGALVAAAVFGVVVSIIAFCIMLATSDEK